jgi:hypothetical protein
MHDTTHIYTLTGTFTPSSTNHLLSSCTPATSTLTHSSADAKSSGYTISYTAPRNYNDTLTSHLVIMNANKQAVIVTQTMTPKQLVGATAAPVTTAAPTTTRIVVIETPAPTGNTSTNSSTNVGTGTSDATSAVLSSLYTWSNIVQLLVLLVAPTLLYIMV